MHLFIFESFISLDTLAPIIDTVSQKNKQKTAILSVNPLNNFKSILLYKYILKKTHSQIFLPLNFKNKIFLFFIKLIFHLPKAITQRMGKIWHFIYGKNYSSIKLLKKVFLEKKIKTITFEESLSPEIVSKIFEAAKEIGINLIKIPSGLNTINLRPVNQNFLKYCDFYLAPNYLRRENHNVNKKKISYFGSLRYKSSWIKKLKKIYQYKKKNDKIKIGILNKENSHEYSFFTKIKNKLYNFKNFEVYESLKPRTRYPIQISKIFNKNILTGEVIYNSDIILCARSSSVIIEAIINNKNIFYLNFINKSLRKTYLYNYKIIKKINSEQQMLKYIKNFKSKQYLSQKNKILKKFLINYIDEKKIEKNYLNLYQNLEKSFKIK